MVYGFISYKETCEEIVHEITAVGSDEDFPHICETFYYLNKEVKFIDAL